MKLDYAKIEVIDAYINTKDYPDFCDSYIIEAEYNGETITEDEIDYLNDNCPDFVYEYCSENFMN